MLYKRLLLPQVIKNSVLSVYLIKVLNVSLVDAQINNMIKFFLCVLLYFCAIDSSTYWFR
jgi:hypothetical protein